MVVLQFEAAGGRDRVQLMIRQVAEGTAGGGERIVEHIVGVVHTIGAEGGLEAALVERLVVRHQGQTLNEGFDLRPNVGEDGGVLRIALAEPMHHGATVVIVIRFGVDERVVRIYYLAAADDDDAHGAYRTALVVGCLEIYGCEVLHMSESVV